MSKILIVILVVAAFAGWMAIVGFAFVVGQNMGLGQGSMLLAIVATYAYWRMFERATSTLTTSQGASRTSSWQ